MTELGFEPLIAPSLWVALALLGAGALVWYAMKRPVGILRTRWMLMISLMAAAMAVILVLLLNPTWTHEILPPGGKPVITILVDATKSMATPDAADGVTRFTAAGKTARKLADSLSDDFDVRVQTFDKSVKTIDVSQLATQSPTGGSTDVAAAIDSVLGKEISQGQAMVLLSDGIHNSGGGAARVLDSARVAKSLACPIYTETFGGGVKSIDLALELKSAQDIAIIGQRLPLTARVTHQGILSGKASVTLLLDGKQIDQRDALLDPTGPTDVHFLISHDKVGIYPYEIRVEPLPGETNLANNSASYVLRVVDEPIRVLVLEGKPYWDSKFFTRSLAADPAVAMDEVVRLSDTRLMRRMLSHKHVGDGPDELVETWKITTDPKEPLSSGDKLRGYQVLVLGRDAEAFLDDNAIANIQSWVSQQGGALVCYRGSPTQQHDARLDKLLPVKWTAAPAARFHLSLTTQGKDLNWFQTATLDNDEPLARMPSLAGVDSVDASKPLAVVLATSTLPDGKQAPAVIYHPYGVGRVIVVEGAGMWRWAFLPPQFQDQEQIYASLWHSMMRWLTSGANLKPGQIVNLRADKIRFGGDEPATATLLAREENGAGHVPTVELMRNDPATGDAGAIVAKTFTPSAMGTEAGVFRVNFGPLEEGRYQARVTGSKDDDPSARIVFDVRRYDQEDVDLEARPDLMARISGDSGGAVLSWSDEASQLRPIFKDALARTHPPQIERSSAWDRWWLLGAAIVLWTVSWGVRRAGGLI